MDKPRTMKSDHPRKFTKGSLIHLERVMLSDVHTDGGDVWYQDESSRLLEKETEPAKKRLISGGNLGAISCKCDGCGSDARVIGE